MGRGERVRYRGVLRLWCRRARILPVLPAGCRVTLWLIFAVVVIVPIVVLALALCRMAAIGDQHLPPDPQLPPEEES
jgi:hypothetical protein